MPTVYRHSREDLPAITRVASRGIQHSPTWCIVPRQNGHILNALPLPAAHAVVVHDYHAVVDERLHPNPHKPLKIGARVTGGIGSKCAVVKLDRSEEHTSELQSRFG